MYEFGAMSKALCHICLAIDSGKFQSYKKENLIHEDEVLGVDDIGLELIYVSSPSCRR